MFTAITGISHKGGGIAPASTTKILDEDARRGYLCITNRSSTHYLFVGFGSDTNGEATVNEGIAIPPDTMWEWPDTKAQVTVISESGNVPYSYAAGT